MIREKSVGIIVYREHPQEGMQYLVLYHRGNYWNFPKGRIEDNESELETGLRELREETGIKDVKIIDGWRQETHFFFKEKRDQSMVFIKKDFILYLGSVSLDAAVLVSPEHNGYAWFDFKTALKHMRFKNLKIILGEAHSLITAVKQ